MKDRHDEAIAGAAVLALMVVVMAVAFFGCATPQKKAKIAWSDKEQGTIPGPDGNPAKVWFIGLDEDGFVRWAAKPYVPPAIVAPKKAKKTGAK